jgi:hypothetical protein
MAKSLATNLSMAIESLPTAFDERAQAQRRADDKALDDVVGTLNHWHERHGFLSDEFPSL